MGKIHLQNIRIYAYHGCLMEEGQIGSDYRVDLCVHTNLKPSAKSDNLKDTVDYVLLNTIIKDEMEMRSKLLETVASRILDRIYLEVAIVEKVIVKISKLNPPIGGDVEMVTIEIER